MRSALVSKPAAFIALRFRGGDLGSRIDGIFSRFVDELLPQIVGDGHRIAPRMRRGREHGDARLLREVFDVDVGDLPADAGEDDLANLRLSVGERQEGAQLLVGDGRRPAVVALRTSLGGASPSSGASSSSFGPSPFFPCSAVTNVGRRSDET